MMTKLFEASMPHISREALTKILEKNLIKPGEELEKPGDEQQLLAVKPSRRLLDMRGFL